MSRMSWMVFLLSISFTFVCKPCHSKEEDAVMLKLNPEDLHLFKGGAMRINCSLCPQSTRSRFSASDFVFNFTRSFASSTSGSSGAQLDGECNDEEQEQESDEEELLEYDNQTDACNASTQIDEDGFFDENITMLSFDERFVRVVDRFTAELNYPSVDEKFHNGYVTCYIRSPDFGTRRSAHVFVGEKPHLPIIDNDVTVRDWKRIEFSYKTTAVNKMYATTYRVWYKNSTAGDFTECPLLSTTTPSPDIADRVSRWQCRRACVAGIELDVRRHDNSIFVFKVNASNAVGKVTSAEKLLDLYDIVKPNPIDDVAVSVANLTSCFSFYSPKHGVAFDYELHFNCDYKVYVAILSDSVEDFIDDWCVQTLPSDSRCELAVRAKPYGYGGWSELSGRVSFQTPERVPLAAPEVCRHCFAVEPSEENGKFRLEIFFNPITHEFARGKINEYRLVVAGHDDSRTLTFLPISSVLKVVNLDSGSVYKMSLTASTTVGYNETIHPDSLTVNPSLSYAVRLTVKNVTALILNGTTVRLSWFYSEPSVSGKRFFVFRCKEEACQGDIHSVQVFPGAKHHDLTVFPEHELVSSVYGVALETSDGNTSGIVWAQCLHNLSRVSLPPLLDGKLIGESLRVKFHLDNICFGGYPYAIKLSYCALRKEGESVCRDEPVEVIVDSSDGMFELDHLPSQSVAYLFKASSLTVAGPSLSSPDYFVSAQLSGSSFSPTLLAASLTVVILVVLMFGFGRYCYRRLRSCRIRIEPPPISQSHSSSSDTSSSDTCRDDSRMSAAYCMILPETGSLFERNDIVIDTDDHSSSAAPLILPLFPILNGGYSDSFRSEDYDTSRRVVDSINIDSDDDPCDTSAGSQYKKAVEVKTQQVVDLDSPPVTDLEPFLLTIVSSERGSTIENDCGRNSSEGIDSNYALGRLAESSRSSRSVRSEIDDRSGDGSRPRSTADDAIVFLLNSDEDGAEDSTDVGVGDTKYPVGSDADYVKDDGYRCASIGEYDSSGGYATTCLRDKETALSLLLDLPATDPVFLPDEDGASSPSSSTCSYAAVAMNGQFSALPHHCDLELSS